MLIVFHTAARGGWAGRVEVVWVAGVVAVAGGLLFGRLESAVHARLRPLAKVRPADVRGRLGRVFARTRLRVRPAARPWAAR